MGGDVRTCLRWFANNKGADQPAHSCSLINVSVIRLLKSTISRLATSEILVFYRVSVTEEADLNLTFVEPPKTGFLPSGPNGHAFNITLT